MQPGPREMAWHGQILQKELSRGSLEARRGSSRTVRVVESRDWSSVVPGRRAGNTTSGARTNVRKARRHGQGCVESPPCGFRRFPLSQRTGSVMSCRVVLAVSGGGGGSGGQSSGGRWWRFRRDGPPRFLCRNARYSVGKSAAAWWTIGPLAPWPLVALEAATLPVARALPFGQRGLAHELAPAVRPRQEQSLASALGPLGPESFAHAPPQRGAYRKPLSSLLFR